MIGEAVLTDLSYCLMLYAEVVVKVVRNLLYISKKELYNKKS